MKKIIYSIITALLLVGTYQEVAAQAGNNVPSEKTRRFLLRYISFMDTATTAETKANLLKGIEMVANSSKSDWVSQYHASFQNAVLSIEKKDTAEASKMLNKAEEYIKTANSIQPNESEIVLLRAMINGMRIGQNPSLGAILGPDVMKGYAEAKKLNAENPRVYLVFAESYMHMPEEAGGGMKVAKANLEIALKKYENDKHEDPAWPTWGKDRALKLLAEIDSKK
ncbi:MAG: hypothetical protein IPO63_01140 [Bacteroidetes bacterium]|nr:hypothetical protein [Bacteroidota bacterium]